MFFSCGGGPPCFFFLRWWSTLDSFSEVVVHLRLFLGLEKMFFCLPAVILCCGETLMFL